MSIILTGGSGRLGKELQKLIPCYAPPRDVFDFVKDDVSKNSSFRNQLFETTTLIIHAGAYTDVAKAEQEKQLCYDTNVIGTRNLASLGIPMLYISTEYIFDGKKGGYDEEAYPNPQNFYAVTKVYGEYEARRTRSVVVRCLFKPRPFEHGVACDDQFTAGDYVDRIAKELALAIKKFDYLPPTLHIGTGRKSVYDLAKQTKPDVIKFSVETLEAQLNEQLGYKVRFPHDCSLDCTKWEKLKEIWK